MMRLFLFFLMFLAVCIFGYYFLLGYGKPIPLKKINKYLVEGTVTEWIADGGYLKIVDKNTRKNLLYKVDPKTTNVGLFSSRDAVPVFVNSEKDLLWKKIFCIGDGLEIYMYSNVESSDTYYPSQIYNFGPNSCNGNDLYEVK